MTHSAQQQNVVRDVFEPQTSFQPRPFSFTPAWARKLTNSKKLVGHDGCVNRLAWNEDGSLLASGSDDRQVLLWSYPDCDRSPVAIQTEHAANIFGVQFLPCTDNQKIVTGAMDDTVMLHHLERSPTKSSTSSSGQEIARMSCRSTLYGCHRGRVKGVEVEPGNPNLFWSAAEDGTVRQYDARLPSDDQKSWESSNCLISVRAAGSSNRNVELKGISLNKAHVHQLAVAAGDAYVRVYDRRMLSTGRQKDAHVRAEPLLQMAPPHLCIINANKRAGRAHTTCVSFGSKGDKVLATYHCDQAYAFDVTADGACTSAYSPAASFTALRRQSASDSTDTWSEGMTSHRSHSQSQAEQAEALKNKGNHAFFERDLVTAVHCYSQAINFNPSSSMLHTNRAAALIARDWVGDAMWALRDTETAIRLDPTLPKAHYRRIQAMKAMNQIQLIVWQQAAYTALQEFEAQFPSTGEEVIRLKEEIYALLEERAQHATQRKWRQMQKKRARDTAAANARNQRRSSGSEAAAQTNPEQSPATAAPASTGQTGTAAHPDRVQAQAAQQDTQARLDTGEVLPPPEHMDGASPTAFPRSSSQNPDTVKFRHDSSGSLSAQPSVDHQRQPGDQPQQLDSNQPGSSQHDRQQAAPDAALDPPDRTGFAQQGQHSQADRTDPQQAQHSRHDRTQAMSSDAECSGPWGNLSIRTNSQRLQSQLQIQRSRAASPDESMSSDQFDQTVTDASNSAGCEPDQAAPANAEAKSNQAMPIDHVVEHTHEPDQAVAANSEPAQASLPDDEAEQIMSSVAELDQAVLGDDLHTEAMSADIVTDEAMPADDVPDQATPPGDEPDQAMPAGDEPGQAMPAAQPGVPDAADLFAELGPNAAAEAPSDDVDPPEEGWMCFELDGYRRGQPPAREGHLGPPDTWDQSIGGRRVMLRYMGHANVQTDIKEAIFLGHNDDLVAAGSDDGNVFIYDAKTGQIIRVLQADADVANCVQCHPTLPVLATSGIEHTIKLWSPDGPITQEDAVNSNLRLQRNQERTMSGPQVLRSISPRVFQALHDNPQLLDLLRHGLGTRPNNPEDMEEDEEDDGNPGNINCRVN